MQSFVNIDASNSLKASRSSINENFESVASDFSGTMFPDVSLVIGMKCYRTDLSKVFRLTAINPPIWTEISDLNDSYVKSSVFNEVLEDYTKSASPSFNVPVIAPKFVGELDGNSKTVSALKSPFKLSLGGSVSSDISLVDGTKDIVINVKDVKAESLKGTATINVKGNVEGNLKGNVEGDLIGNADSSTKILDFKKSSDSFSGATVSEFSLRIDNAYNRNVDKPFRDPPWGEVVMKPVSTPFNVNFKTTPVVKSGTYTLQEILQILINNCHFHSYVETGEYKAPAYPEDIPSPGGGSSSGEGSGGEGA